MTTNENETYMKDSELATRYSVSRQTVWRWCREGRIPKPVKFSDCCSRWALSAILANEKTLQQSG